MGRVAAGGWPLSCKGLCGDTLLSVNVSMIYDVTRATWLECVCCPSDGNLRGAWRRSMQRDSTLTSAPGEPGRAAGPQESVPPTPSPRRAAATPATLPWYCKLCSRATPTGAALRCSLERANIMQSARPSAASTVAITHAFPWFDSLPIDARAWSNHLVFVDRSFSVRPA